MKRIIGLTVLLLATAAGFAQTPKPALTAPAIPQISPELKVKFFKAQAQELQAQSEMQQAQKDVQEKTASFQGVVQDLVKACGGADAQMGKDGDPVCVAKAPAVTAALPKR